MMRDFQISFLPVKLEQVERNHEKGSVNDVLKEKCVT